MGDNPLARFLLPATRAAAILSGWCLLVVVVLICVEIVGRKLFSFSLHGVDEIGGYALALVCAFGFSYVLLRNNHTRVGLVQSHLPARVRAALNAITMASIAAVSLFAAWRGFAELKVSIELMSVSNSPLQTPMWLPQGLWFAGLAMFGIVALALAVHAVLLILGGRGEINRFYAPAGSADELEQVVAKIRSDGSRGAAQ
jgi:TRAP-type C4-dicarboxylate transport system permease small subunit